MKIRSAAGLLALMSLSGCVATQRDMMELGNQTDELKHQVSDLKGTVTSLQANQAELAVSMKELLKNLSAFDETVRESQTNMEKLSSKLDDMNTGISDKVSSIGESLVTQQAKMAADQKAASSRLAPSELFHDAEVRLAKKDFDLAAKGFEEYIAKHPKGALIDVAVYNLGESLYRMNKWEESGKQFGLFLDRYPKSKLTASGRLMYALCLVKLNRNTNEAKQYLDSIVTDFPSSSEAKAAAKEIKKLAESGSKKKS